MARKRDPWMKLYPTDWRSDPALKMCSRAARSLWLDLCGIMHEASPYGFLLVKGHVPTIKQLVSLLGDTAPTISALRAELQDHGVFSRVGDVDLPDDLKPLIPDGVPHGTIFSRRMLRDAAKAAKNRANGQGGGNPDLVEKSRRKRSGSPGESVNPPVIAQMSEARSQSSDELRNSSGGEPPTPLHEVIPPDGDIAWAIFNPGLQWLGSVYRGEAHGKLRGVIGGWLKLARGDGTRAVSPDDHGRVWQLMVRAYCEAIADPKAWIVVQLGGKVHEGGRRAAGGAAVATTVGTGETGFQARLRAWRDGGRIGPMPQPEGAADPEKVA